MSTISNVAPVGGLTTAYQLQAKPPENLIKGSAASQTPVSDTYTAGQEIVAGAGSGTQQAGAVEEYQKISRLGNRNGIGAKEGAIPAIEQQAGVNAQEDPNQVAGTTGRLTNPYQTQQLTNNLATRPDAALQSAISFYA